MFSLGSVVKGAATTTAAKIGAGVLTSSLNTAGISSALRSLNLPPGGELAKDMLFAAADNMLKDKKDWRVRLSMPERFQRSSHMKPLVETNGFVFPFTPSIQMSHSANYQTNNPIHNNYSFLSYESSKIDEITIQGDFFCETISDASYWIGAVHYLRSVTKMSYGETSNTGSPPPVVKLNGYGDFVFKNVPVVVTGFTVDLPNNVDYISTAISNELELINANVDLFGLANFNLGYSLPVSDIFSELEGRGWAPAKSSFTVRVHPMYTREQVRKFSLDRFVSGEYIMTGKGFI